MKRTSVPLVLQQTKERKPKPFVNSLNAKEIAVIEKHVRESDLESGKRIHQWNGVSSVFYEDTGRMWAHNATGRKQALQELYFYRSTSTIGTITCSHKIKIWDLKRSLLPRECARLQGFPENMRLPTTQYNKLFGNAVCVPDAQFALSRIVSPGEKIRHLDICSGIGGFSFALQNLTNSVETVGFSEIMPAAIKAYQLNFPDAPNLGDAQTCSEWPIADLVTAGFPCQPFSRSNSKDKRETHTSRNFYRHVLDIIEKSQASKVVLENVPTLQATGDGIFETILQTLRDMNFHVTHTVLNSKDSGVPQQRRRLYIVASKKPISLSLERDEKNPLPLSVILEKNS